MFSGYVQTVLNAGLKRKGVPTEEDCQIVGARPQHENEFQKINGLSITEAAWKVRGKLDNSTPCDKDEAQEEQRQIQAQQHRSLAAAWKAFEHTQCRIQQHEEHGASSKGGTEKEQNWAKQQYPNETPANIRTNYNSLDGEDKEASIVYGMTLKRYLKRWLN